MGGSRPQTADGVELVVVDEDGAPIERTVVPPITDRSERPTRPIRVPTAPPARRD